MPRFALDGRRALVTGGDAGIGLAIAGALAAAGARVALNGLGRTEETAAGLGRGAIGIDADIGEDAALERLIGAVEQAFGGLDILVLNAAIEVRQPWHGISPEAFDRQVAVNLKAGHRLIKAFVPAMAERGWGRLLAIGSVQEHKPHPDMLIYAGLKAAMTNMVGNLARQLAGRGVTCNVIQPGVIVTGRNAAVLADEAYRERVLAKVPAGTFGLPEDCAGTALLLCSDAGRYITGAAIPVDGGMGL
jgi:NAD(P)-dependent dehydrogenase (short-subunit alcohol dehydrogenase family)